MDSKQATMTRKLQEGLLVGRRVEGDRLVLDDATLNAALDGSRPLTAGERTALQASPLTARRLRQLALDARARRAAPRWQGSRGMLRAASTGMRENLLLATDDGWWTLHLVGAGAGWRAILQLAPQAPFAPALLAERAPLRVLDGAGRVLLEGALDADGECEAAWALDGAPADHLQQHGAAFSVAPARP